MSLFGFLLPARSDGLPLSVKSNSTLTVEISSAPHRCLVACEGEHGKGNWDGQVDANLAGLDLILELTSSVAIFGKDRHTISPFTGVDKVNGFLSSVYAHNIHDRTEDFFIVAGHALFAVVNNGRANPVTLGVASNSRVAAIK